MKKQRAIDAIALYEQISAEVGSIVKAAAGNHRVEAHGDGLQAPTISSSLTLGRTSKMGCRPLPATSTATAKSPSPSCLRPSSEYTR